MNLFRLLARHSLDWPGEIQPISGHGASADAGAYDPFAFLTDISFGDAARPEQEQGPPSLHATCQTAALNKNDKPKRVGTSASASASAPSEPGLIKVRGRLKADARPAKSSGAAIAPDAGAGPAKRESRTPAPSRRRGRPRPSLGLPEYLERQREP